MSFLEEFGDLLAHEVTREPLLSIDSHGQPTWGTAAQYPCHIVRKPKMVRSTAAARSETEGSVREVVSNAQVYTDFVGWLPDDRITLPDGSHPLILAVGGHADEHGDHHQVVYV